MDRSTKATLWIAFIVIASYFVWFFLDCALDSTCHLVCVAGGRGTCHTERSADPNNPGGANRPPRPLTQFK